jgi:hypothetical protein
MLHLLSDRTVCTGPTAKNCYTAFVGMLPGNFFAPKKDQTV